jgi:hypothetical protein
MAKAVTKPGRKTRCLVAMDKGSVESGKLDNGVVHRPRVDAEVSIEVMISAALVTRRAGPRGVHGARP